MAQLASDTTQQEILWASNLAAPVVLGYFVLLLFMYSSYINILEIDEQEHKNDLQTSFFEFTRKVYFVFSYSKSKTIFSKKTFVLQIVGHFITLVMLAFLVVSFFISIDAAMILLSCSFGIVLSYGIIVGVLRDAVLKKVKNTKKKPWHNIYDDENE